MMKTDDYLETQQNLEESVEQRLNTILNPINPNPDFVHRLKKRLVTTPVITVEEHARPLWLLMVLAGGLVIGVLFYWLFGKEGRES